MLRLVRATGMRFFGRHPKHDVGQLNSSKQMPRLDELTGAISKTMRKKEWKRQPFARSKFDSKEEIREKRDLYLYQRSLPVPVIDAYLHGADLKISRENTFRRWWIMDAREYTLGRLAAIAARLVMGKHKPIFDRSLVLGDFVIVTNAPEINVIMKKNETKLYRYHTGFPGGLVETPYQKMVKEKPEEIIRRAVAGMLPKNNLRKERMKLLRVFRTSEHPHLAEEPTIVPMDILEARSPWLAPKEQTQREVEREIIVLDENRNPMVDLVDNHGNTWTEEEAEWLLSQGTTMLRDPEIFGKDVPEPRTDTLGNYWKKKMK